LVVLRRKERYKISLFLDMWRKIFGVICPLRFSGTHFLMRGNKGVRSYRSLIVLSEATYPFRRTILNFLHCAKIRFTALTRTAFSSYYLRTTNNTRVTCKHMVSCAHYVCPTDNNVITHGNTEWPKSQLIWNILSY
jgi:hypothetical protein